MYSKVGTLDAMHSEPGNAEVAENVRTALESEGYSQKEVAARLGISVSQTSRLLSGKSSFRYDHVATIGRFLGINPRELLGIPPTTDTYMTVAEAADMARRHRETIRKAIISGQLDSVQRVPRGRHLVRVSDLKAWMAGAR